MVYFKKKEKGYDELFTKKKLLPSLALIFVMALPFVVHAASWSTTYEMKVAINSKYYSLSKGTASVYAYNKSENRWTPDAPTTFRITLYDKKGKSYGSNTQSRLTADISYWDVPAKGDYWFKWTKANDGNKIKGNAKIENY